MLAAVIVGALLLAGCAADTPEESEPVVSEGQEDRPDVEPEGGYGYQSPVGIGRASPPEGEFVDVSVSSLTSCGVRVDGSLVCWGDSLGELPSGEFTAVSVGEEVGCALRADSSPVCWGSEWRDGLVESGLLEPPAGKFVDVSVVLVSDYLRSLTSLTGCGVRTGGSLVCWGGGHYGQLDVPGGEFTEVVTGPRLCALSVAGGLACWGDPYNKGLLYAPRGVFQSVSSGSGYGYGYACAVRDSGELVCWGANPPGGDGPPSGEFTEVSVAGAGMCALTVGGDAVCWGTGRPELDTVRAGPFTQISASNGVVCALRTSGEAECWGARRGDETGYRLQPGGEFTQVALYNEHLPPVHACGIRVDTTISCWKYGAPGTLVELVQAPQESPQLASPVLRAEFAASAEWVQPGTVRLDWDDVAGVTRYELMWYDRHEWRRLSESEQVSGAVMAFDGSSATVSNLDQLDGYWFAVRAINFQGASKWSPSFSAAEPYWVAPLRPNRTYDPYDWMLDYLPAEAGFASVAVAEQDACALRIDGTVVCWGVTRAHVYSVPLLYAHSILSPTGEFTQIAAVDPNGYGYYCGLRVDTSVTCWTNEPLGVGLVHCYGPDRADTPVTCWTNEPLGPDASFEHENRAIEQAQLGSGFCSIDTTGQVTCWEHAYFDEPPQWAGQLAAAAVGPTNACGIRRTDSTLACWDTATGEPADTPQGPFNNIDASVGGGFCAITTDGSITCWDTNSPGYFIRTEGRELLFDPPAGEFTELAVGAEHACAIRTDNTLACWGDDGKWDNFADFPPEE